MQVGIKYKLPRKKVKVTNLIGYSFTCSISKNNLSVQIIHVSKLNLQDDTLVDYLLDSFCLNLFLASRLTLGNQNYFSIGVKKALNLLYTVHVKVRVCFYFNTIFVPCKFLY